MHFTQDISTTLNPADLMQALGLTPDPWQREVLRAQGPRTLLLCCRQAGKSTVSAVLALHEALYRPGSLVLMLAPALRQSQELFRKLVTFYDALGRPVPAEGQSVLRLELANGSRVVSLPGTEGTIRGFSNVRLLVVDEAARVPDALYYAVRPMLAVSQGRLIALSTPFGSRGWFHHEWAEGSADWSRIRIPASQCPRISAAFLEEERHTLGPWWFAQEYDCHFVDTVDQVFATHHIDRILDPTLEPLFPDLM